MLKLHQLLTEGRKAFLELSSVDRFFHFFWLLGPFILLIERTPGDIWISVLALAFLYRALMNGDKAWFNFFWVRSAFTFLVICLLSAALSRDPLYSFIEALIWFRFPLFAMASAFWLAKDRRLLQLMMLSTAVAVGCMCCILFAELIVEGYKDRLSWPYDDLVPGNFLAKVGLPIVVFCAALSVSSKSHQSLLAGCFCLIVIATVLMTGERINLLTVICASLLSCLLWRPNIKYLTILTGLALILVLSIFEFFPATGTRFVATFIAELPISMESGYYKAMAPAFYIFQEAPFFGIGPGSFRFLCKDYVETGSGLVCFNHPHNFYLQLLAETGSLGAFFGVVFMVALVVFCFTEGQKFPNNLAVYSSWIVPFALFWPIRSSADFFGQWNNIFLWSAVAVALAVANNLGSKQE